MPCNMKKRYAPGCVVMLILSVFCMVSCHMKLEPATVLIVDPVRHYYPVIQGDMMEIRYAIENTSSNPLFIEEIQTSCGCIVPRGELPIVVLPHKVGNVDITYNTIKNTGYVKHYVYCYGNFKDSTYIELAFDTNVVPQADYIRDYEQLWHEQNTRNKNKDKRGSIDALSDEKGYYTD